MSKSTTVRRSGTLVLALFVGLLSFSCGKKSETAAASPSAPAAGAPAAPPPTPTEAPVSSPAFTDTAAAGLPPWSGLSEPRGAALDGKGRLWVADFGASSLRVFDASGGYLGGWGGKGTSPFAFNNPTAVAVAGDTVYVADTWNARVESFSLAGASKASVVGLYGPRGIAVGPGGAVFVADTGNNRVMIYDADLKEGHAVGARGNGPDQFVDPVGVAVSPSGAVYVADVGNRRIQVLDANGKFVGRFAVPAWTTTGEPFLAVGTGDVVYLSDPGASAVLSVTREGKQLHKWEADDAGRKFGAPTGLAYDAKTSTLFVVDKAANTVSTLALGGAKKK